MQMRRRDLPVVLTAAWWNVSCRTAPPIVRVERDLMGTVWILQVVEEERPEAARRAVDQAFAELERIDRLMSEWKPESPLSAINAAAGGKAVETPPELCAILERAIAYGRITGGTFDVTWRGMGDIWRLNDSFRPPTEEQVQKARANVNYAAIEIEGNRVRLPRAGMKIGLGGIAKGYAVDRALETLTGAGFAHVMVEGGGDIRVSGSKRGEPWRLGIQDPRKDRGVLLGRVAMTGGALVTSGDYERFRILDGVRYHHIIDPRTGRPATASRQATVLATTAEQADALSKGLFILGGEKGLDLIRSQQAEGMVIDDQGKAYYTPGFAERFEPAPDQEEMR